MTYKGFIMKPSINKIDSETASRLVLFPYALAAIFISGFFCFLFYIFSGVVDLKDPTVSGLAGATLQALSGICMLIIGFYYGKNEQGHMKVEDKATQEGDK